MVGMLGAALPVAAYDPIGYASRDYQYANDLLNSFQNRFQYDLVDPVRKRVYREQRAGATSATTQRSAAPAVVPTTFRPTGAAGGGVDKLVSAYPANMQGQVRTEFRKLLDGFRQIEKQFGLPPNDVASAVAAFLAGSYMGYRNANFPDEHFKPLVAQMREALATDARFAQAGHAERQDMFEQLATLGMLMATTQIGLQRQPNAGVEARMRQTGKAYLEAFLKTGAERVRLTAAGLRVD